MAGPDYVIVKTDDGPKKAYAKIVGYFDRGTGDPDYISGEMVEAYIHGYPFGLGRFPDFTHLDPELKICDWLHLPDKTISRHQATIYYDNRSNMYMIRNEGNRTVLVNGVQVTEKNSTPLKSKSAVRILSFCFAFLLPDTSKPQTTSSGGRLSIGKSVRLNYGELIDRLFAKHFSHLPAFPTFLMAELILRENPESNETTVNNGVKNFLSRAGSGYSLLENPSDEIKMNFASELANQGRKQIVWYTKDK